MVRDLWPRCLGRPIDDDSTIDELADWQLLPATFDGICDALDLVNAGLDTNGAVRHKLVYSKRVTGVTDDRNLYEVCLRLQGSIQSCKIGPLGDWNG